MKYLRLLLLPVSLLYGLAVAIRNWCYDAGLFKSYKFKLPVISVGNLAVGGAGKTPMTEYLVKLLKDQYKVATLSRGYGRKTKGYLVAAGSAYAAAGSSLSARIGDEPAQISIKFPDVTVAVCADRVMGIKELAPAHDVILLDDAYQHRAVSPGLSILLFDHESLQYPRFLLPAGNLREPVSGRWRAQVIVVTKCPPDISLADREGLYRKIGPLPYQQLFFSAIDYGLLYPFSGRGAAPAINAGTHVFLLTGIANAQPLVRHLTGLTSHICHHKYPDHHRFSKKNIIKLAAAFHACKSVSKVVITTEKDAQRLAELAELPYLKDMPLFIIPLRVKFLDDKAGVFDRLIITYVSTHTALSSMD